MKGESKQTFWTRQVRAFEGSGQTRRAYCERRGLGVGSLDYWRRKLSSASISAAVVSVFVPLTVSVAPAPTDALILECAGGSRLKLPRDCDPLWLAQMLSGLR